MQVRRFFFFLLIVFSIGGFSITSASAGAISATTVLQDFNALIFANGSTQSDIEGAAVIGGNFSGATMYNNPTASQPAGYGALTVFGNTSGNSININDGGNAYVGGTRGAQINFNGGGFYTSAPSNTINDFKTSLTNLSTTLSQLAGTSTVPPNGNNEVFNAVAAANGMAVFNITAAQLANIPSFSVNLNGASTVVINVDASGSGGSVSYNANDQSGSTGANNIIWNFYNAATVSLNTLIGGTVLATAASVTNQNQIDGALIANSWSGSGELHSYAFTGTLPAAATVPEPGSFGLLGLGLVALGYYRRQAA